MNAFFQPTLNDFKYGRSFPDEGDEISSRNSNGVFRQGTGKTLKLAWEKLPK